MTKPLHLGAVTIARRLPTRIVGLMGKRHVGTIPILFPRCSSIHTYFMRVPVDVLCLDRHNKIVRLLENVRPWRVVFGGRATRSILEAQRGYSRLHRLVVGKYVEYVEWKGF